MCGHTVPTLRFVSMTNRSGRRPRVAIIGLGDTGLLVAVRLSRRFDVVGISTRPALISGMELGNRLTRPAHWRRNFFIGFERFRKLERVDVLHGRVTAVDPAAEEVDVELADGGRRRERYDALVIASGASNGFWRHDRVEHRSQIEHALASVADRIGRARTIAVIGGGATGVGVAANLARTRSNIDIHLFHAGDVPLPGYHPRVRDLVSRELLAAGVHVHPGHRAVVPEGFGLDALTTGPVSWSTGQQPFVADVTLWAVGRVRPHTDFLPADMLDEDGFVEVDEHLRATGLGNVFAVGDVAASDPHRSSARNFGYLVVARNVRSTLDGRRGRMRSFRAPAYRWGSVLGVQDDGMVVYRPNGSAFRVPSWAVEPLLFRAWTRRYLYGGVRPE